MNPPAMAATNIDLYRRIIVGSFPGCARAWQARRQTAVSRQSKRFPSQTGGRGGVPAPGSPCRAEGGGGARPRLHEKLQPAAVGGLGARPPMPKSSTMLRLLGAFTIEVSAGRAVVVPVRSRK